MCGQTLDLSSCSFNNNLYRRYSSYLISIRPKYFLPVNSRRIPMQIFLRLSDGFGATFTE